MADVRQCIRRSVTEKASSGDVRLNEALIKLYTTCIFETAFLVQGFYENRDDTWQGSLKFQHETISNYFVVSSLSLHIYVHG